jgi:hypothetical protein
MEQQMNMPMGAEDMGRATDTVLGHLSLGEVVIPRAFLDDPQVMQLIQQIFQAGGADMAEYTVGDPANKINPETGYPEFFKFKKIFRALAPAALAYFAPGLGSALGSSILGANAVGASTLGNALIGGAVGGLTGGGLKGAALGALSGGIGANLGKLPTGTIGGGETLPWNQGSGILGTVGRTLGVSSDTGLGNVLGGLTSGGGGGSSFGVNNIASALGGFQQDAALKKIKQQQLGATGQQLANLERLNPTDVQNDPGYQFTQAEGEQALNRSLGARGSLFSGAALKEAADYNQGLASRFYGDAYQRQQNQIGQQNQIYGTQGDIRANATLGGSNNLNQTLANALGANVGNYQGATAGLTTQQLLDLLRQRGVAA